MLPVPALLGEAQRRMTRLFPAGGDLAAEILRDLTPPAWTLEWHLPWWLGHGFGLDRSLLRELVISNVLGLLSVRLDDDAADGELAADARIAGPLARAAYAEALVVYRAHLAGDERFWAFLDRSMADWRAGSDGPNPSSRGAPLKIAAYACCLLGDRPAAWAPLDRCLDDVLAALVLYDQFCDWDADLAAGRWNAFVASVTGVEQVVGNASRNRASVLAAMLTDSAVGRWFRTVDVRATEAAEAARAMGLGPLHRFLVDWATRTRDQGAEFEAHYRRTADRATEIIFGAALRPVLRPDSRPAPMVLTR